MAATTYPDAGGQVSEVDFDLNGEYVASTSSPSSGSPSGQATYSATIDTSNESPGVYQLTALTYDFDVSAAPIAVSAPIEVSVRPGEFVGVTPDRVLDTRKGTGIYEVGSDFGASSVGGHQVLRLQVQGSPGLPPCCSNVSAVVINVTATQPQEDGYVTAYPDGDSRPVASNLNFNAGDTVANLVTVGIDETNGDGFDVDLYNGSDGAVQLVADVVGYYTSGSTDSSDSSGRFEPLRPARILDTRHGTGGFNQPVGAGQTISFAARNVGGVPSAGAGGVVLHITATQPTATGYLTAWETGAGRPLASILNFAPGATVSNLVELPLGPSGDVSIYNGSAGPVQVIADVVGYYTNSSASWTLHGLYLPLIPSRILDTRFGTGAPEAPVQSQATLGLTVSGAGDVPAAGVTGIALNATVTAPVATGYLTVYPAGQLLPATSNLNFTPNATVANLAVLGVSSTGQVDFYNGSGGSVQEIADAQGFFS